MAEGLIDAVVSAQVEGANVGQAIGQAAGTATESTVDALIGAQIEGAATGQAVGPAAALAQHWSFPWFGPDSPWWWLHRHHCQGLLQTVVSFLPGTPPSGLQPGTFQFIWRAATQAQVAAAQATAAMGYQAQAALDHAAQAAAAGQAETAGAAQAGAGATIATGVGGSTQVQATAAGQAQAAAAIAASGGEANPLVGAMVGGAETGGALGPAVNLGAGIPSTGGIAPWLGESGIKGPLGSVFSAPPQVGGILFDRCAEPVTTLQDITAAYWDDQTGSLVLMGRHSVGETPVPVPLPVLDRDHMTVALRATLGHQPLGVSIDPPAEYRDGLKRGEVPPDGTAMWVSYLGNTRGTLFGAIMFEADRLLKCLDKGVDNKDRKPCRAQVPGFRPLLEMISPGSDRAENVWHRFWFVIDHVELREDPATKALAFGDVKLKVLTETEMDGAPDGENVDPIDAAFADHLTRHYDEYAKEFPILARLKDLAKIAALAKYLCNLGVPLDLQGLFSQQPAEVVTPDTTPGISVTSPNVEVRQVGSATHTRTVSLFGGVDLDAAPHVVPDDGTARRLAQRARSARPGSGVRVWRFGENGEALGAVAVPLGRATTAMRQTRCDLSLPATRSRIGLTFSRTYDAAARAPGPFGVGWSIALPYRLTVIPHSSKRAEVLTARDEGEEREKARDPVLVLHNMATGESVLYRRVEVEQPTAKIKYCQVTSLKTEGKTLSFSYDPSRALTHVGECWEYAENGHTYYFDLAGRLLEIRGEDGSSLNYEYEDGRLASIRDSRGRFLNVAYEPGQPHRVSSIRASDGRALRYEYGPEGNVTAVVDANGIVESYAYDEHQRLVEVRDREGRPDFQAMYDDLDHFVTGRQDVVDNGFGDVLERTLDEYHRLACARDRAGTQVEYEYGHSGELRLVRVCNPWAGTWELTYDVRGRLCRFQESGGMSFRLYHDEQGALKRAVNNRGCGWSLLRDEDGKVARVDSDLGQDWQAHYDGQSRLVSVVGPGHEQWRFTYRDDVLRQLDGPGVAVGVAQRKDFVSLRLNMAGGWWKEVLYDHYGRPVQVACADVEEIRHDYDEHGRLSAVSDRSGGAVSYQADEQHLTVKVVFS